MLRRPSFWLYCAGLLLFLLGIRWGLDFPDIDQRTKLLQHRSFLTHGVIFPAVLLGVLHWCLRNRPRWQAYLDTLVRLCIIGVCLATVVHLCFDLFPRSWRGFALIYIPFYGRATPTFSWMWLGTSCVLCLYIALLLIKHLLEALLSAVSLGLTFILECSGEPHVVLPLGALLLVAIVALALPSRAAVLIRQWAKQTA